LVSGQRQGQEVNRGKQAKIVGTEPQFRRQRNRHDRVDGPEHIGDVIAEDEWQEDAQDHRPVFDRVLRCSIEIVRRDVQDRGACLLPTSVTYNNVETTQVLDRAGDEFLTELLIAKIAGDCQPDAALGLDQLDNFFACSSVGK
jgi:hypothetical protein